jgi:hypothetical protein
MNYQNLLNTSRAHLHQYPVDNQIFSLLIFTSGAEWMMNRMNEMDSQKRVFDNSISYEKYGYFKYGICLFAFFIMGVLMSLKSLYLLPLAILVFYIFEIHFLFLFPLSIDKVKNPIKESIQMTYRIGIFSALKTVIPIGFFMMLGLLNFRNPLKNWYLGCLSILIWYMHERK